MNVYNFDINKPLSNKTKNSLKKLNDEIINEILLKRSTKTNRIELKKRIEEKYDKQNYNPEITFLDIPTDVLFCIIDFLIPKSLHNFYKVFPRLFIENNEFWNQKVILLRENKIKVKYYGIYYVYDKNELCYGCDKKTVIVNDFFNMRICRKCQDKKECFRLIASTHAKREYKLNNKDLEKLPYITVKNPYFGCAAPMILYMKDDIIKCSKSKHEK